MIQLPTRPRNAVLTYPRQDIELHDLHESFRIERRDSLDPEWFVYEVCKSLTSLPAIKADYQWHVPCSIPTAPNGTTMGWRISDYVIIGPYVSEQDVLFRKCLSHYWGKILLDNLELVGINPLDCVVTHAVRFPMPPGATSYSQGHKKACAVYAQADAYACQPRAIITLGSDALKVLFGKDAKLDSYRGAIHEWKGIPVVPTCSPLTFATTTAGIDVFRSELNRATQAALHNYVSGTELMQPGYRICRTLPEVLALEHDLVKVGAKLISIDTEFGNLTARDEDNKLRTLQCSWDSGQAALVVLRGCGMVEIHSPEDLQLIKESLQRLLGAPEPRLEGHHLRVDIEQPHREGMDLDHKLATGFCTLLARHLLHGSSGDESDGLDHIVRTYVPEFGNYWKDLEDWLSTASIVDPLGKTLKGRKNILQFGYAYIPDEILFPYALRDADATWQAARKIEAELEGRPKIKKLYWDLVMPTALHLLDVERQGIKVDMGRIKELRDIYLPVYEGLLEEFRAATNWPAFNPNSKDNKASFLFSTTPYRDKKPAPEGVVVLSLTPLYNSAKYPENWVDIKEDGTEKRHFPSCKANTLEIMWKQMADEAKTEEEKHDLRLLKLLRHLSVIGKFLSSYLTLQELNDYGFLKDGKNIGNNVWKDGRVRCRLHQTSETGRYRSQKPNLQTNPKKQEEAALEVLIDYHFGGMSPKEYRRRTDDAKNPQDLIPKDDRIKVRMFKSCFVPAEGNVFIEVDFKSAELWAMAYASGDKAMIKVLEDERDIHCETACKSFQLPELAELDGHLATMATGDIGPYKRWEAHVKKQHEALRVAAKAILFGLCLAEGTPVLTNNGWKPIEQVTNVDMLWDGATWVNHDGVVCTGTKDVVCVDGVQLTADHEVLTDQGWMPACQLVNSSKFLSGKYSDSGQFTIDPQQRSTVVARAAPNVPLLPMTPATSGSARRHDAGLAGVQSGTTTKVFPASTRQSYPTCSLDSPGRTGTPRCSQGATPKTVSTTRRMAGVELLSRVTCRTGSTILSSSSPYRGGTNHGPSLTVSIMTKGTSARICESSTAKRTLATPDAPSRSSIVVQPYRLQSSGNATPLDTEQPPLSHVSSMQGIRPNGSLPSKTNAMASVKPSGPVRVYDIVNAGPNHRFQAGPLIVHNCYGRSAGALMREIGKVVKGVTLEMCERIIKGISTSFPVMWAWLQANKRSAIENEYVENLCGRCRYFKGIKTMDKTAQAAAQREASNMPVQSLVADLLAQAGINLYNFRYRTEIGRRIGFRVVLPIHDAFLVECSAKYVEEMKQIIQICMSDNNLIPGTDGKRLFVDIEVYPHRWGEKQKSAAKAA
jgi:DNA polymerase I-like protein with 3'-5' exonuclease and polymerase domains/uracil-DNA glycosylase